MISLNDKNDAKCKNKDIIMLNNQKAEESSQMREIYETANNNACNI